MLILYSIYDLVKLLSITTIFYVITSDFYFSLDIWKILLSQAFQKHYLKIQKDIGSLISPRFAFAFAVMANVLYIYEFGENR